MKKEENYVTMLRYFLEEKKEEGNPKKKSK